MFRIRVFLAVAALGVAVAAQAYEEPAFTVVAELDDVEYRRYEPYLVAETQVLSDKRGRAANTGFRRLFDYISGANRARAKIDMTSPVQQAPAGKVDESRKIDMTTPVRQTPTQSGWTVAFVVPREFSKETVPQPTNPDVYIREVPAALVAVLRYSGRWTQSNVDRHKSVLIEKVSGAAVATRGEVVSAFYNAPFTLPFMRRNEVQVEVTAVPGERLAAGR